MKISVITVCKNAANTIENSLLSLYSQTYENIEHIVIDGVSTDGTLELLSKYKDKISTLISEPDTGIYNAMNKGIKFATGDIVYFLNATDALYDENVFEKAIKEFKNNPDLELLWGDVQFVENNKDIRIARFDKLKFKGDLIHNNPCHQVIFYKNDIFKKCGDYNENLPIYADYDFNVRVLVSHSAKCKYIPEVLARFELGGISTSSEEKIKIRQKQERKDIYKEHFSKNIYFQLDNFFTKVFGTPTKYFKESKLINKILQAIFKENLMLNKIP